MIIAVEVFFLAGFILFFALAINRPVKQLDTFGNWQYYLSIIFLLAYGLVIKLCGYGTI